MILAALWYAIEDPCVNTYLRPIIDEVNDLYLKGMLLHNGKLFQLLLNYHIRV